MFDLYKFFRYQIPGFICISYIIFLLIPFIRLENLDVKMFSNVLIAAFLMALPLGYFLYQIYLTLTYSR